MVRPVERVERVERAHPVVLAAMVRQEELAALAAMVRQEELAALVVLVVRVAKSKPVEWAEPAGFPHWTSTTKVAADAA
jgi:hypothetical protein